MMKVAEYNSDRTHKSYNLRDAEMWYNKAAEKGNKTAIAKVNEFEKEKKSNSEINSKKTLAKGKSKFDRVMDKIGAVLDTSGKVIDALSNTLTDIEAIKSGNSIEHTNTLSENSDINSSSDLILVDPLISKYSQACAKLQNFEKDISAIGSKYTIKKWNDCIEWLSRKKIEGNGYISKTEWEEYEANMNRQLDSKQKQFINNHNVISNDLKTMADNQDSRNYRSSASTLERYHDYPSETHYNYDTDIAYVRKLQKSMREARARIKCKKSKWEDWDGVPGSMK